MVRCSSKNAAPQIHNFAKSCPFLVDEVIFHLEMLQ